jgi:hypothetical protein
MVPEPTFGLFGQVPVYVRLQTEFLAVTTCPCLRTFDVSVSLADSCQRIFLRVLCIFRA